MDLNFGINSSISTAAARPITVKSSTAIALLAITTIVNEVGLHKFNNAGDAITWLKSRKISGDGLNSLKAISSQGVDCPIVLNLCLANKELDALDLFTKSEALTGINLFACVLIAPALSTITAIGAKLDAISAKLKATALIDNFGADEGAVIKWAKTFGTKDSLLCQGKHTVDSVSCTTSAIYAGIIAYWDAKPFGWAKSHSNRPVKGMSATDRAIEYVDGQDSEARRMRQAGVVTILADIGWRTYGFETTHIDPIWQSLDRVRTFNRLLQAIMKASKWARDREANELLWVKKSVQEFMNEMIGADVGIGFSVFFDNEKNTKATVTAGKFYLTIKFGDMPSVKELNIELVYSDDWNELLVNYINGGE